MLQLSTKEAMDEAEELMRKMDAATELKAAADQALSDAAAAAAKEQAEADGAAAAEGVVPVQRYTQRCQQSQHGAHMCCPHVP